MSDKPATGGKRFFKLASMTASVASNYARSKVKSMFLDEDGTRKELSRLSELNGERIVETLGELKGAVMKVGQMASLAQDILPKEIGDALGKREAPPMPYEVIADQIEREFALLRRPSLSGSPRTMRRLPLDRFTGHHGRRA